MFARMTFRRVTLCAVAAVTALTLSACNDDDSGEKETVTVTATPSSTTAVTTSSAAPTSTEEVVPEPSPAQEEVEPTDGVIELTAPPVELEEEQWPQTFPVDVGDDCTGYEGQTSHGRQGEPAVCIAGQWRYSGGNSQTGDEEEEEEIF